MGALAAAESREPVETQSARIIGADDQPRLSVRAVSERLLDQRASDPAALNARLDGQQRQAPQALAHHSLRHADDLLVALGDEAALGIAPQQMAEAFAPALTGRRIADVAVERGS